MVENIIAVLSASLGTVGFSLMLRLRRNRLPIIALSTAACFTIYLIVLHFSKADFMANFMATLFAAWVSELLAKHIKAPVTVFLIPTILPLVPGAALYYTIESFFKGNLRLALTNFSVLGRTVAAILMGIVIINTITKCIRNYEQFKLNK